MANDTGKTILMLGVVGAGGYLLYEYSQYSTGINAVVAAAQQAGVTSYTVANLQTAVPFTTYLEIIWGLTADTTKGLVSAIQAGAKGTLTTTASSTTTPGTTTTMQQSGSGTSVSTAPTSTPNATAQPSGTMTTLANNMAQAIGMTTANADQWNYAFNQIMGQGIDAKYSLNFDQVYGAVVNGKRNNGATMSALMFLQLAASAKGGSLPGLSGFGRIAQFAGPRYQTTGNMLYQAHHPFPYQPSFNLAGMKGMGAYTQASGFERALWAGGRGRLL